jgi:hypothetical protein
MNTKNQKKIFPLLKNTVQALFLHKEILFPYAISIFIQLVIIEILYFLPRSPLNVFFGPIIKKLFGENYLHYPLNLVLLPKLFQYIQMPVYIFISSILISASIAIISTINSGKTLRMQTIWRQTFGMYIHVMAVACVMFLIVMGMFKLNGMVINRAMMIRSQTGLRFLIKQIVLTGAPFWNMLLNILGTTIFAYIYPAIIVDRKKFFAAIIHNFKTLARNFWFTLFIVSIPSLFYLPILLLSSSIPFGAVFPELSMIILIVSIFILILIDAVVYTALTTFYLMKKEEQP